MSITLGPPTTLLKEVHEIKRLEHQVRMDRVLEAEESRCEVAPRSQCQRHKLDGYDSHNSSCSNSTQFNDGYKTKKVLSSLCLRDVTNSTLSNFRVPDISDRLVEVVWKTAVWRKQVPVATEMDKKYRADDS